MLNWACSIEQKGCRVSLISTPFYIKMVPAMATWCAIVPKCPSTLALLQQCDTTRMGALKSERLEYFEPS